MHRDARDMILKCKDCHVHRPLPKNPQQPLTPIPSPWPFYKWGIDIAGPFLEGPGKVKFLIVVMDYFTKWIEAKAVATISGSQVKLSFDRITFFLVDDELKDNRMKTKQETENSGNNIRIQDRNFAWDPESTTSTLRIVSYEVKHGKSYSLRVMKDGQVTQSGTYEELLTAGTTFEQLVNAHKDVITCLEPSHHENKTELYKTENKSYLSRENSEVKIPTKGVVGVQLTEEEEKATGNALSDASVIDFDIPFSIAYVIGAGIEILATIAIMVSVTLKVHIVAIIVVTALKA
ncbi:reverse transcriptase domain-containing protein [Tanacetum coccineum]